MGNYFGLGDNESGTYLGLGPGIGWPPNLGYGWFLGYYSGTGEELAGEPGQMIVAIGPFNLNVFYTNGFGFTFGPGFAVGLPFAFAMAGSSYQFTPCP